MKAPKADPREPVILSDEQFEALLTACGENDMLRLYVLALGDTGERCESEVLFLQWDDVSLEDGSCGSPAAATAAARRAGRVAGFR